MTTNVVQNTTVTALSRPFSFICTLLSLLLAGCNLHSTPHSNAMDGWRHLGTIDCAPVPKPIEQDARAYFQTLPRKEKDWLSRDNHINYWEDRTGQHAVVLDAFRDGEFWTIALIYNRDGLRIKVLRYSTGAYMS